MTNESPESAALDLAAIRAREAERYARQFHETYERLAPMFGYETRKESAVPWENVPQKNRALMIAVAGTVVLDALDRANANVEAMRNDSSKNKAYREVAEMAAAFAHLFPSWVNVDPDEPDWPVLYAQLPTGQVSWHFSKDDLDLITDIPRGGPQWDGHTREERSARLATAGDALDRERQRYADLEGALEPLRSYLEVVISPRHLEVKHERDGQSVNLSYGEWRAIARALLPPVPAARDEVK